jgi:hypothetical protein
VDAIGAASECDISAPIDEDPRSQGLTNTGLPCLEYSQRKFKQLSPRQILFPDLYEIHSQVHLIPNDLKQRAKTADCFSIGYVVAFHKMEIGTVADLIGYERKWADWGGM